MRVVISVKQLKAFFVIFRNLENIMKHRYKPHSNITEVIKCNCLSCNITKPLKELNSMLNLGETCANTQNSQIAFTYYDLCIRGNYMKGNKTTVNQLMFED